MINYKSVIFILFITQIGCVNGEKKLTQSEISHGDEQVRNMLRDRPEMSIYVDNSGVSRHIVPDDEIWKWSASKFAGKDFGMPISWSSEVPVYQGRCFWANHSFVKRFIRVGQVYSCGAETGSKMPFDLLWRFATFELLNIEGAAEFKKIHKDAIECKLNKEEYIRKNLEVEYAAVVLQNSFYKDVWLPWTKEKSVKSEARYWNISIEPFNTWVQRLKENMKPDGWENWEYFYDSELKPFIEKKCFAR